MNATSNPKPSSGSSDLVIAERATQAEILKFARTPQCLRNDMIHVKGRQRHVLKSLAILASVFRGVRDELA